MVETRTGAAPSSSEWLSITVSLRAAKEATLLLWVTRPVAAMVEQPESTELASSGAKAKQMPDIFKTRYLQSKEWARSLFQGPELDSVRLQSGRDLVFALFY